MGCCFKDGVDYSAFKELHDDADLGREMREKWPNVKMEEVVEWVDVLNRIAYHVVDMGRAREIAKESLRGKE